MMRGLNNNNNSNSPGSGGGGGGGGTSGASGGGGSSKSNNPHARAVRILMQELKSLQEDPIEGFRCKLLQDSDLFHWEVAIFGPPDTPYSGGYFKALMSFPTDYPFSPPTVKFLNKIWHSNIYHSGEVCISILHPPNDDPQSGELPQERWNPAQSVRTVLMSIISLLNEPNTASPANVDASVMYRRWKESGGKDKEYEKIIRQNVEESLKDAAKDGVEVPKNADEYTAVSRHVRHTEKRKLGEDDFYAEVDWNADSDDHHHSNNSNNAHKNNGSSDLSANASRDFTESPTEQLYDADDESSQVDLSQNMSTLSGPSKSLLTLQHQQQLSANANVAAVDNNNSSVINQQQHQQHSAAAAGAGNNNNNSTATAPSATSSANAQQP